MSNPMESMPYDAFSQEYDRFVNWPGRLAVEMPFLQAQLKSVGARQVLDAACGTGMHAIALARLGYQLSGADLSPAMLERARKNALSSGVEVRFESAGFGQLSHTFGSYTFAAVLCLGNSLPHLLTPQELSAALLDFADCLKPGGMLLIQNRNFDAILQTRQRWMEPQSAREGRSEWLFLRFYDFDPDGLITFNIITLRRQGSQPWTQSLITTRLRPILAAEMRSALVDAGFGAIQFFGDMTGSPFDPSTSGNLVVTATLGDN